MSVSPVKMLVGLLLAAVLSLALAAGAQAQDICGNYPDLPQCIEPDNGGGDPPGSGNGGAGGGGSVGDPGGGIVGSSGDSGAELPFTGYPLSPLLVACLILLAGALALRGGYELRQRRRSASSA